jgi:hypothetical protein
MPEYAQFPQENIDRVLALAGRSSEGIDLRSADMLAPEMALQAGPASFSAGCIGLVSQGSQVCLRVPIVGDLCVPVDLPDGTFAEACVDLCTHWGIPTGVCVRIRAAGANIFSQCFGWC